MNLHMLITLLTSCGLCCTYQEILSVSRFELHGSSELGSTSKAAITSAAWAAEVCHWKVFDDDTCSHDHKKKMICQCSCEEATIY